MKPDPHSSASDPAPRLARRGMLLGAAATAGAGAVAVLAARSVAPEEAAPPLARAEDSAGYRLSEHVRRYYETART